MQGGWELVVAGEPLVAMPQKALWWPAESTLFVADVHLGKDASFQATGIPLPLGATTETLERLTHLLCLMNPQRLVMLGDLWHAKAGRTKGLLEEFCAWRAAHSTIEMLLVEGNHDARSGPLPKDLDVREVQEPYSEGPFVLCHYPAGSKDGYVLSGHVHPGVRLEGKARQSMLVPCFWFGTQTAVLPSFGSFTGCCRVLPRGGDQVLIVAGDRVRPAPLAG